MASTTYPTIESGSFDAGSTMNLRFEQAELTVREKVDDITGSHSGTAMIEKKFTHGLPTGDVVARGHMALESTSTSGVSLSQASTFATPGHHVAVQDWQLRKFWNLSDVTCSGNAVKQWQGGFPIVQLSVRGVATNTDATSNVAYDFDLGADDPSVAISMDFSEFGTLACTAMTIHKKIGMPFFEGGPVPYTYAAFLQTATTWTPDSPNYVWLYPNTAATAFTGSPVRGTMVLDIDASSNISESALCYDVTLSSRPQYGGKQAVVAKFRWD